MYAVKTSSDVSQKIKRSDNRHQTYTDSCFCISFIELNINHPTFYRFLCQRIGKFYPGIEGSTVRVACSLPFCSPQSAVSHLIHGG